MDLDGRPGGPHPTPELLTELQIKLRHALMTEYRMFDFRIVFTSGAAESAETIARAAARGFGRRCRFMPHVCAVRPDADLQALLASMSGRRECTTDAAADWDRPVLRPNTALVMGDAPGPDGPLLVIGRRRDMPARQIPVYAHATDETLASPAFVAEVLHVHALGGSLLDIGFLAVRSDFVDHFRLDAYLNDADRRHRGAPAMAAALAWLERLATLRAQDGAVTARTMRSYFLRCLETEGVRTGGDGLACTALDDGSLVLGIGLAEALREKKVHAVPRDGGAATRLVFGPWLDRCAVRAAALITAQLVRDAS